MMIRRVVAVLASVCAASLVVFSCQGGGQEAKDQIVKVGKVSISQESFDVFRNKFVRRYPGTPPQNFPGMRQPHTFMVDCEAIWQHVKSDSLRQKIKSSLDWKWKEKFFKAGVFIEFIMGDNLGFTDAELLSYYKKHLEVFRVTLPVADGKDTTYVQPFDSIKRVVADRAFYDKHRPDSAFIAQVAAQDDDYDEVALRNHWLYNIRTNPQDFFMRQIYLEKTGEPYDTLLQIYAEDGSKAIKPEDMETVRLWLPENQRHMMPHAQLVDYLYKWEIFSEYADKRGLISGNADYKHMMYWALRADHAFEYIRTVVESGLGAPAPADAAVAGLAELIVLDYTGFSALISSQRVQQEVAAIAKRREMAVIDSVVNVIRRSVNVVWYQDEFKDERNSDPVALFARADSLREAAVSGDLQDADAAEAAAKAESLFRSVVADFAFAPEGRKAMAELAKMLIDRYGGNARQEKYLLSQAISFYRRAQELETDADNLCNSYFMVGFAYDEHLKNYSLAESNYRWILRHAPACALASDAEFMILHLGEPMTSIEEIRGQSIRQGRQVDFEEDGDDDTAS